MEEVTFFVFDVVCTDVVMLFPLPFEPSINDLTLPIIPVFTTWLLLLLLLFPLLPGTEFADFSKINTGAFLVPSVASPFTKQIEG